MGHTPQCCAAQHTAVAIAAANTRLYYVLMRTHELKGANKKKIYVVNWVLAHTKRTHAPHSVHLVCAFSVFTV